MSLSVNFIDCLIVLVVVVSAGYACWRGFIWETLTIFSWVTASVCCLYFGPYIVPLTASLVGPGWLANLLGYASVFLAIFIPFAFISHRFSETVKHSPIGPLDRAAGDQGLQGGYAIWWVRLAIMKRVQSEGFDFDSHNNVISASIKDPLTQTHTPT